MDKRTILYRGNLKSCNYSCSYCPFSKHKPLKDELERDWQNFGRFCDSIESRTQELSIGAILVTPYGEASIHRWYWEGLARLSGLPGIDRVGMQTNLSFSVEECLRVFDSAREKLCIWATFHPEMTTVDEFAAKCHQLIRNNVMVCAGAVGVPQNIPLLRELREKLSPSVYLWINKMDGLRRNYRPDEIRAFAAIDPFFEYELRDPVAAPQMCADRCFVEADGKVHTCNISKTKSVNWYDDNAEEIFEPLCSRKRCTCYLAYGGRADFGLKKIFGDYPLFRIPKRFQAVFFDLDGTLLPEDKARHAASAVWGVSGRNGCSRGLSDQTRGRLTALREMCPIFLATSMPAEEAGRRLKGDMDLFQGFIFASGGYLYLKGENGGRERVYPVDIGNLSEIEEFVKHTKARFRFYRHNDAVYKVTIIKRHNAVWSDAECDRMAELLDNSGCRFFTEKNCLEIVSEERDKGTGIQEMCRWIGIPTEDVLAVGNDKEDAAMERVCTFLPR